MTKEQEEKGDAIVFRFMIGGGVIAAIIGIIFLIANIVDFVDYFCVFISFLMIFQLAAFGAMIGTLIGCIVAAYKV